LQQCAHLCFGIEPPWLRSAIGFLRSRRRHGGCLRFCARHDGSCLLI
jgi:hypothetical protein